MPHRTCQGAAILAPDVEATQGQQGRTCVVEAACTSQSKQRCQQSRPKRGHSQTACLGLPEHRGQLSTGLAAPRLCMALGMHV